MVFTDVQLVDLARRNFRFFPNTDVFMFQGQTRMAYCPFGIAPSPSGNPNIDEQIVYATARDCYDRDTGIDLTFNMNRFHFFFDQLRRSEVLLKNPNRTFGIRFVFVNLGTSWPKFITEGDYKYGEAYAKDFGIVVPDGSRRRKPLELKVWPFDIMLPMTAENLDMDEADHIEGVNMPVFQYWAALDHGEFIEQLRADAMALIPQASNSGEEGWREGFFFVNAFLLLLEDRRALGGFDISGSLDGIQDVALNMKSCYMPRRSTENTCFWQCIIIFMVLRASHDTALYAEHPLFQEFMFPGIMILKNAGNSKSKRDLTVFAERRAPHLMRRYAHATGEDLASLAPLSMEKAMSVLDFVDCSHLIVINTSGDCLFGEADHAPLYRAENNKMLLVCQGSNHVGLVTSYTGLLSVKKCLYCDKRFQSETALRKHLEAKVCLRCVCMGRGEHFDTVEMWRYHVENLMTVCPKYVEVRMDVGRRVEWNEEERRSKRFVHDSVAKDKYQRQRDEMRDRLWDASAVRNHEFAIFFDLETIVPVNSNELSASERRAQQPYAAGWMTTEDVARGKSPTIAYGLDCLESFVSMLDRLYDELLVDEERLMREQVYLELQSCAFPRKIRGFCNMAKRVQSSWDYKCSHLSGPGCLFCNEILEVAHGYTVCQETGALSFSECAIQHYIRRAAEHSLQTNKYDNSPRVTIWAHNGGRFDWVFVHRYFMEMGMLDKVRTIRNGSKYFELKYRDVFVFRDSLLFMAGSLDTLAKNFAVETMKGMFPYRLMDGDDKVECTIIGESSIRQMIPPSFLQVKEKVAGPMGLTRSRAMTEDEYRAFFESRGWSYNVKEETIKYLEDDILCLAQIIAKFKSGWDAMPQSPKMFKYCTIGQLCHQYFFDHYLRVGMYPMLTTQEDSFIRQALYGGRTEVFTQLAPEEGKIHYVDVNSLYPYVMESRDLPCGDPLWHLSREEVEMTVQFQSSPIPVRFEVESNSYFESLAQRLNDQTAEDVFGFLQVDVRCNISTRVPVLPERRNGKNMFTNMTKKKTVYYSEELKRAIRKGCFVDKVYNYSEWQRGRMYGPLISVLKEQKMLGEGKDCNGVPIPGKAKNPSLRAAAKTAQNSLFGKTIQYVDSQVALVYDHDTLWNKIRDPKTRVMIEPIYRSNTVDVVEVTSTFMEPRVQRRSCCAVGTAILAEARLVLYDFFETVDEIGGQLLYCDTDSIVYSGERALPPSCLHETEYGKMKVEIDPESIMTGGFVAVSPKCYSFLLKDGSPYVRCKGVSLSRNTRVDGLPDATTSAETTELNELMEVLYQQEQIEKHGLDSNDPIGWGLSFSNLKQLVLGDLMCIATEEEHFKRTKERTVCVMEMVKTLTPKFDKRIRSKDANALTIAWNDYNANMDAIVRDEDVRALSDFLRYADRSDIDHAHVRYYATSDFFQSVFDSWSRSDCINYVLYKSYDLGDIDDLLCLDY